MAHLKKTTDSSRKNCSQKNEIWSASTSTQLPEHQSIASDLPKKPANINRPGFKADVPTMASIAAKNVPEIDKAHEWIMVQGKGSKKGPKSGDAFPDPVKNSIEQKRRVIFHRRTGAPAQF